MALEQMFGIAGSALNAQTSRMNASAANLANAGVTAGSEKEAFRAKRVEFKTIMERQAANGTAVLDLLEPRPVGRGETGRFSEFAKAGRNGHAPS